MSSGNIKFSTSTYSGETIIVFTLVWIIMVAIVLTTKEYRNADFVFVSNRLSSNLANIALLFTAAIVGGFTAILGGVLLRVVVYFYLGSASILIQNIFMGPGELLLSFIVTALYLLLLSSVAYFCGMLAQLNRMFLIILPAVIFLIARSDLIHIVLSAISFFTQESSFSLLFLKVIYMVGLLFGSSLLLSNKLEVR